MLSIIQKMKTLLFLTLLLCSVMGHAQTINAVYFGQSHVLKATDTYFGLVGNRETLIKVHVTAPGAPASPTVTATLTLSGQPNLVLTLTGPATLPASIPDGPGVVQHSFSNTFTGYLPAAYVKKGLQISVNAGTATTNITNLDIGAPSKVIMTMFDVHYFSKTTGNYPTNSFAEIEAKWPVADLEVRRLADIVFPELVIPPRGGAPAARIKSKTEYELQTGLTFDGEQAAALEWNAALKRAAGRSGRWSLYYLNVYNAAAGGQAGGFAGVGNGTSVGILHHELGHALSLPHWGDSSAYPYKGNMHGITAPNIYNDTHSGPAWAFDLRTKAFIPPTVQAGNVGGNPVGTYKVDPMQGGGTGYQEPAYLMNHFSDYSVDQMRSYLHSHMVVWNPALGTSGSYASWNQTAGDYTTTVTNNGVQFPTTRDTQVISIMASMSGVKPDVNMVYPPIGPYNSGLIRLFDATIAADRTAANTAFALSNNCDYCVRVVQGGVQKTYIVPASALTSPAQTDASSLETEAINLPASAGTVTKIELLSTPNVEDVGLPANPTVLYTWAPLTPDPASFENPPVAYGTTAVTMNASKGALAFGYTGTIEYLFTETSGNPGGTSSSWQTSRSYTDNGLNPGTQYSYTVSMRAGTLTTGASAPASATTYATAAPQNVTVNSTQQFSLQSGNGLKSVTGLGTFNAGTADKLVVVISTEDSNNNGIGYVYDVRYNGKVMTEALQEDAGSNNGTAAIFYLDNPGAIGSGTIQVSAENPNGGIGCAYALSNTLSGYGAYNSRSGSTVSNVALTTSGEGSVAIAVINNSGNNNSSGTPTATTTSPSSLTQASSGMWGSQWGGHASGYRLVATPTSITPGFSTLTGSAYSISVAAVEFPARPPMPNTWIQTAGGTWNWTTAANWDDGTVPNPTSGDMMDFSSVNIVANTTLNLEANRTAQLWKFGDTSGTQRWTVSAGQTLTLAGAAPGFQINNGTTQIDSVIAGTAGLSKTGAGNLTLTASNTYTGATTITTGILQIGNAGSTGALAPSSAITNNAALVFNRTNTLTQGADFASVIAGTGSLTKNGSGILILSGANTYTGTTTISAGTLQIGNNGTSGTLSTTSAITNNSTLVFQRSNGIVQGLGFANAIAGTGALTNAGNGTLTLNVANAYSGLSTINAGSIKVLHANALGATTAGTVVNGTGAGSTSNARLELEGGITVAGETLTINGAGNFYGALSSTSGSNTWAGNVTIGSTGTRLGSTTGNTLTVSGIIDSGTVETGLNIRTQDIDSTVVLSGANAYLGDTNVLIGKLQLNGGNNRLPISSRLLMGNAANISEFDLNGRNQEVAGVAIISGSTAANNSINNSSVTAATLTVNPLATISFAGILKGNLALTKTGMGTQTLSGVNTYTGATRINNGVLQSGLNDTLPITTALSLGSGATVGSLNLSTFNQTVASLAVNSDSADNNTISIGSGKILTVTGNLTVGFNSSPASNTTTKLFPIGLGTLHVTGSNFQIGGSINSGFGNAATLDMSGLSNFIYNNSAGTFRVGDTTNSSSAGAATSTLILADTSTITAQTFTMNSPAAAEQIVRLGSGLNVINADTIQIGAVSNRSPGSMVFHEATGSLSIRGTDGQAPANMTVAYGNGTTAVVNNSSVDFTGHSVDLLFGTLQIGGRTGSGGAASAGTFSFDSGNLSATSVTVGLRAAGASAGNVAGTLNLAGGTVNIGSGGWIVGRNSSTTSSFNTTGAINISGGTVSVLASYGVSIRLADSTAAGGTANGILNLTGGSLTVEGDILRGASTGTSNATILLNGGTLNMGGHDLGAAGSGVLTFTVASGTLQNVATINGTGGLTKTSTGMLTLLGTNTYVGATTISAGSLVLGANNVLPDNSNIFIGAATLDATTRTDTIGTLNVTAAANINLGNGAALTFANSSAVNWTGTLNISGTFVSGSSIRFGTTSTALTATQLGKISATGFASFSLDSSGFLVGDTAPASSYTNWQTANNTGGVFTGDHDNDGVVNGIEYFLGGNSNTTGQTILPGITNTSNTYSITWVKSSTYQGTYGTHYWVESTSTLSGPWTQEALGENVTISGNNITYTFPATIKRFARLIVADP
jgi:autotransporter-associated beta strand protein